jgi:putative transcriptional regulator
MSRKSVEFKSQSNATESAKAAKAAKPAAVQMDLTNQFLIAMPGMADPQFSGAVIYLCEHSQRGALGLIINKPTDINVSDLFDKVELSLGSAEIGETPVYFGGPVQTERGFVLHDSANNAYTSSLAIPGGLEMTTSRDILEALANGAGPKRMAIMLGYAGWSAGQLEDELGRNGWLSVDADPAVIFDTPCEQRFNKALALLGVDPSFLSSEAGHA